MKYFIDTEFYEKPNTISLISLAIVAEDGREFYRWNRDYNREAKKNEWLVENVFPFEPPIDSDLWISESQFAQEIDDFIGTDSKPEFWGYYCDYDWVIFCWLFGRMIDLPNHFPMYCKDLIQLIDDIGKPITKQIGSEHNALADARWIKQTYYIVKMVKEQ
jgi:hypothetical protein